MKKFAFVSDFDGTISKKDFYWIMIDKYLQDKGLELFKEWKDGKYKDIEFLSYIFNNINKSEMEIDKDIFSIEIDEYLIDFIKTIKDNGGDFIILSAGTDYYIKKIIEKLDIQNIKIYSNPGHFDNGGIYLKTDKQSPFYSERYGIDKQLVIEDLKNKYDNIYFAGDSAPDVNPASISDIVFSKPTLTPLLKEKNIKSIEFNDFKEIEKILKEKGVLK